MEKLWAPWRMAYVGVSQPTGCVFCGKAAEGDDAASLLLHRGEHAFIMLNAFPYNNGHLMIAPYRHTAEFESLTGEEHAEIMALCQLGMALLRRAYSPDGYNLGHESGQCSGSRNRRPSAPARGTAVERGYQLHAGGGGYQVLPDSLQNTYARLRAALADNGE